MNTDGEFELEKYKKKNHKGKLLFEIVGKQRVVSVARVDLVMKDPIFQEEMNGFAQI